MNYVGVDVHKKYSVLCALDETGRKLREGRVEGNASGEKKWGQISTFDISLGGVLTVARWAQPHHPKIDNFYPSFANLRLPRTERTVRVKLP
jgi:hypothetical protein